MKINFKLNRLNVWLSIIFSLTIAALYFLFRTEPLDVETALVTRGTFQEVINVDGVIRSKDHQIVTAFAEGDIKKVSLKVGDLVKKGDRITELLWDIKYQPVLAPIDGVVSKILRESAGPIHRGEPIIEILNPNDLEMMAELLTTDAVQVTVGDPVTIEGWGLNQEPIYAKITRISKAGYTKISALGVEEEKTEVTADLRDIQSDRLKNLGSNFHAHVLIQISEFSNVLKIPIGSIFRNNGNWSVYKIKDNKAHLTSVEISARNNNEALITGGLLEGEIIINYPGDLIHDGSKIHIH